MRRQLLRLLSFLMALVMLFALIPATTMAEGEQPVSYIGADGVFFAEYYGGGGSGTTVNYYKNDYIILKNSSSADVDLSSWSVQYLPKGQTSATTANTIPLVGSIVANGYYLIKLKAGSQASPELPVGGNVESNINLATDYVQLALVKNTTPLTNLTRAGLETNPDIADFVGADSCSLYLGTKGGAKGTNTYAVTRQSYTNDNSKDWVQAKSPRYPILRALADLGGDAGLSSAADNAIVGWTFGIKGIDTEIPVADPAYSQSMNLGQQVHFNGTLSGGKFYSHGSTKIEGVTYPKYAYGAVGWELEEGVTEDDKAFYFSFATTGYKFVTIGLSATSSKAGPKHLQVQFKIDGEWVDLPGGLITIATASTWKTMTDTIVNLPIWDQELVEARVRRVGNVSCETHDGDSNIITSGGSCQIDDIMIKGEPMAEGEQLNDAPGLVSASPDPSLGPVPAGTIVTLTCETPNIDITYKVGSKDYQIIPNGGSLILRNGALITAMGYDPNTYTGRVSEFQYTIDNTSEPMGAAPGTGPVVIEQVYGQGGNKSSFFTADYVVLRNISDEPVDIGYWSLMFASQNTDFTDTAAPTQCYTFPVSTVIRPHGYYLIKCSSGTSGLGTYELENVDIEAVTNTADGAKYLTISGSAGKLALVANQNTCLGSEDDNLIDMVCWGSPNDYLGNGPAPQTDDPLLGLSRVKPEGDSFAGSYTGDNIRDFYATAPNPKSSLSAGTADEFVPPVYSNQPSFVTIGDSIELSCDREDATIYYSVDKGQTYQVYTSPFDSDTDILTVQAYACRTVNGSLIRSDYSYLSFIFLDEQGKCNMRQARALQEGTELTVSGTVTFVELNSSGTIKTFTMQDETGGITVRGWANVLDKVEIGKQVTVRGQRGSYRGLAQILEPTLVGVPQLTTMPTPIVATCAQLSNHEWAEEHESMYVVIRSARMGNINYSGGYGGTPPATAVIDDTGTINIHYIPTMDTIMAGDIVDVYAVLTQSASDQVTFKDGYYLRIAYQSWIDLIQRPAAQTDDNLIVAWNQGTGSGTPQMLASDGPNAWCSVLTGSDTNGKKYNFNTSKSSMACSGWNGAGRYLQFEICTKGYRRVTISAKVRSSASGPRDFKMQYSLDGQTFTDIEGATFTVAYNQLNDNLMPLISELPLPEQLWDREQVFIRWVLASQSKADGSGTVGSAGNFNFTAVRFCGNSIDDGLGITATPNAGDVALGDSVRLAAQDESAQLYWRRYLAPTYEEDQPEGDLVDRSTDNWLEYTDAVVLSELPYVLQAYCQLGDSIGRIYTFNYSQAKCAPVKSTSYSGAIRAGRQIILSSATVGASIHATLTYNLGTAQQSSETMDAIDRLTLSFEQEQFPVRIEAYASRTGYLDSEVLIVELTLQQSGGERLYFGQSHSHTTLSDGSGTIEDAYEYGKYSAKNLDYLIVTDHSHHLDSKGELGTMDGKNKGKAISYTDKNGEVINTTRWELGHLMAQRYTDSTFVADFGYEMTWSGQYGHMNTYATEGFVSRNDGTYTISGGVGLQNYYDLLTQYPQSISMFNHPGDTFGTFDDFAYYTEDYDQVIQLIEVGNGEGAVSSGGYWPSYEQYVRALDKGWHIAPANNQDNHKGKWGDSNTCRDVAWTNDFTRNGILQAMREMRMYATEDNNLEILYSINGEPLGTIFDRKPDKLNFSVSVFDPDNGDKDFTMSVITTNGKTVYRRSGVIANNQPCVFEFELDPEHSYYYIRIDQSDRNIAVTAPIWVGSVVKAGVSSLTTDADFAVMGESMTLTATIFNQEDVDFNITSIEYLANGTVFETKNEGAVVSPHSELLDSVQYTPQSAGTLSLEVRVYGTIDAREQQFVGLLDTNVLIVDDILDIAIDASHSNHYISGDSANSYSRFEQIASAFNGRIRLIEQAITPASLNGIELLVITAPYEQFGADAKVYTQSELNAIATYADGGGSILICGKGDRGDGSVGANAQLNAILAALGTDTRLRSDTVIDLSYSQGASYNITLESLDNYNLSSKLMAEVKRSSSLDFVYYCGASVDQAEDATVVIRGNSSTMGTPYSNLAAQSPYLPIDEANATVSGTNTTLLSQEKLLGGGNLIVCGTSFFNDYQLPEVENTASTMDVNYYLAQNTVMTAIKLTPIAELRSADEGLWFAIEGTVTTNGGGHDVYTAFFDSIYVQDETGGINLFPVAGDFAIGQRIWASGFIGSYQGDHQLSDVKIYLLNDEIDPIEPQYCTTYDSMRGPNQGKLINIQGVVESFSTNAGAVEYIFVNDGSGTSRVFLDGYIYCDCMQHAKNATGHSLSWLQVGSKVSISGIASTGMHPDDKGIDQLLPRIRIRNRAEIVEIEDYEEHTPTVTLWGDADCNGTLTSADAAAVLRAIVLIAPLSEQGKLNADVDGSGRVDSADAALILRLLVRLIPHFPAEQ